ncbi:DUF6064 family protein [Bradyrhizobium sp. LA7.1]|uniref:DUF6064 family protein n=1 Tax=Bradyrhizobium sp. LA7.1 TaxID=3156324 RepID=UPI0033949227
MTSVKHRPGSTRQARNLPEPSHVAVHVRTVLWCLREVQQRDLAAQLVAYVLGAAAIISVFFGGARSDRLIAAVLAIMWAWTGVGYHLAFFAVINNPAYLFGALFVARAAVFAYTGVVNRRIAFGFRSDAAGWIGCFFVLYAAVLYPLIGLMSGHSYPGLPTFGVTPCPVTIFTFGLLLLTRRTFAVYLLAIPALWSLIGGSAAILLNVPQDWMHLASGIVAMPLFLASHRRHATV